MELMRILNSNNIRDTTIDTLQLTPRGKEVFQQILAGATNKSIAERLGMSLSGVRRHREKMLLQNKCDSMFELVSRYYSLHGQNPSATSGDSYGS